MARANQKKGQVKPSSRAKARWRKDRCSILVYGERRRGRNREQPGPQVGKYTGSCCSPMGNPACPFQPDTANTVDKPWPATFCPGGSQRGHRIVYWPVTDNRRFCLASPGRGRLQPKTGCRQGTRRTEFRISLSGKPASGKGRRTRMFL